jgi:hypothetical protein
VGAQPEVKSGLDAPQAVTWIDRDHPTHVRELGGDQEREALVEVIERPSPGSSEPRAPDGVPAGPLPRSPDARGSPPDSASWQGSAGLGRGVAAGVGLAIALLAILAAIRYTRAPRAQSRW